MSKFERGFRDCGECHGEGIVRRHAYEEMPELTPMDMAANEQSISCRTEIVACPECAAKRARLKAVEGRMPSKEERQDIPSLAHWLNANMEEGSRFFISDFDWSRLSAPYNTPFGRLLGESAYDRLMSNLIGSGWGAWVAEIDPINGGVRIERHKPGNKRTYTDYDRRHLYKKIDGELVHWDCIKSAEAVADIARMISAEHRPT
mgnify:CR=1 FL=1